MKYNTAITKSIISITTFILCCLVFPGNIMADGDIISRDTWGADTSLLSLKTDKNMATSISVDEFVVSDDISSHDVKKYIQGLYFYMATEYKKDLPFNYAVGWDGNIYEGVSGGYKNISNPLDKNTIHIAYINNGHPVTPLANKSFLKLFKYFNSVTGIGLDDIKSSKLSFDTDSFKVSSASDSWNSDFKLNKDSFVNSVPQKTSKLEYKVQVNSIKITNASDGNKLVSVSFKNVAQNVLGGRVYAGADSDSKLYIADKWISPQRTNYTYIDNINTGETGNMSFEIPKSMADGTYELNLYNDSSKIDGSILKLDIKENNVTAITPTPIVNLPKIKIKDTGVGYLNVRDSPSLSGKVLAKVDVGATFDVQETSTTISGKWYKIKYKDYLMGWVNADYTSVL